jgi:hypothetical protein
MDILLSIALQAVILFYPHLRRAGMMRQTRLHIRLGNQRTTISADTQLCVMLAAKLGQPSDNAAQVAREWLQARLPDRVGTDAGVGKKASQAAREMMIDAIVDKKLSDAWSDYVIERG